MIHGCGKIRNSQGMRTFGLIPAAGKSRRMGLAKLLLPLAGATVLDRVLEAVRLAGVAEVLVVVAPDAEALATVASAAGARVLRLNADTPDMRATCEHGLTWLGEHYMPSPDDGWLLLPADHPTVEPTVIRAMIAHAQTDRSHSIFVPTFQGKRGHPTWLRWQHAQAIRTLPLGLGLNAHIRAVANETLEIEWENDEILRDLDTPGDYAALLRDLNG